MEKKMNRIKNLIALGAFSLLILGLPAIASAQWRDRDRDDDYNRGGRNNGRYNQLDGVIRNLENRAKRFEDQMDRQDNDNGGYGRNNRRNDNLEELSDRFVNAAKRLDNEYDDRGDFNRSRDEAQRVLEIGSQISRTLSRSRGGDNYLYNEWNGIENDLRIIANAYGLNYDNGNNRNNRNNRGNGRNNGGGGWRNNFPFPF
jgi:hypothetical protein